MAAEVFGVIAGVLTSIRLMPQVYRSYTLKETRDLSMAFLVMLLLQAFFLTLYGLAKPDLLIAGMNIPPLACSIILLVLKGKYQ